MKKIRVLIVDDQPQNVRLVKQILDMEPCYLVDEAVDGEEAFTKLKGKKYDALLTDWLMPKINGVELIKRVRSELTLHPYIIMITAIQSSQAKKNILEIGADEFISKPLRPKEFLVILKEGLARKSQPLPKIETIKVSRKKKNPPFMAVVIAASTGGYEALLQLFSGHLSEKAAYFVVQHAPKYSLNNMALEFKKLTNLKLELAKEGEKIKPGRVYIAPGDRHLSVDPKTFSIRLNREPKENYVRPSADRLFRSAALVFGKYTLGIVLTGLGVDGTEGAAHIKAVGGEILAQDPETAIAPRMPKSIILSGLTTNVVKLSEMNSKIESQVLSLAKNLETQKA